MTISLPLMTTAFLLPIALSEVDGLMAVLLPTSIEIFSDFVLSSPRLVKHFA